MATFIPNRTNEALMRLGDNLLEVAIKNRQFQLEEQRIGLEERRVQQAERTASLDRLMSFAPFLRPGSTIGENAFLHDDLRTVFPTFDPEDPGDLGGLELNPQTLENVLRPMMVSAVEGMDPEAQSKLLERGVNRAVLGVAASGTELEAQETQARIYTEAWNTLRQDPRALEGIMRQQMGLQPLIRINYKGREIVWDNSDAARLSVQLMMHQDELQLKMQMLTRDQQTDFAKELMEQMSKHGISLGRPGAEQIVRAYSRRAELFNEGQLTEENDPLLALARAGNDEVRAAVEVFSAAGSFGEDAFMRFLRAQGPGGEQLANGLTIAAGVNERFPTADVPNILESILRSLNAINSGEVPSFRANKFWRVGGAGFQINQPIAPDPPTSEQPARFDPQATRQQMEADAAALAGGTLRPSDLVTRYPDAQQRAAVIARSRQLRSAQ